MNRNSFGILYIVATPIGNIQDITLRAIEILKSVNCIAVEDTRHSQPLLQHYGISTPLFALHDHNERDQASRLLVRLQQGESIALISDAGTPLISDPGYFIVKEARATGIAVVPLPGPCAAIAAVSVAGLPTDKFIFEGFLPAKTSARQKRLEQLRRETRTMIFYEAPHRILELLKDMQSVWGGERQVVLARELTKLFETIRSDTLDVLIPWVTNDSNQQRGELVVVAEGAAVITEEQEQETLKILQILLESLPLKQAVDLTSRITQQKKNAVYEMALQLKQQS